MVVNTPATAGAQAQQTQQQQPLVDYTHWKEPKIVVKILLAYFKEHQTTEILLLFQLLRAFCGRGGQKSNSSFVAADFQFFKDFLETEVCEKYSVEWKRAAFFEFVRLWKLPAAEEWLTQVTNLTSSIILTITASDLPKLIYEGVYFS